MWVQSQQDLQLLRDSELEKKGYVCGSDLRKAVDLKV